MDVSENLQPSQNNSKKSQDFLPPEDNKIELQETTDNLSLPSPAQAKSLPLPDNPSSTAGDIQHSRPYLETLLSQLNESSEVLEDEDFDPDIKVMERHRNVDEIVDKLSSVYAKLKVDFNVKPDLHRFKWEATEEYIDSESEEEIKYEQNPENLEECNQQMIDLENSIDSATPNELAT